MPIEGEGQGRITAQSVVTRPLWAASALLGVYLVLSMFNATGGYLGTDTGAKVATLQRMSDAGTFRPEVGYWAEAWDPDGVYHPLYDTGLNEDDEWVNVTTLPMLLVARPLYDLGGYRLALLPPMLGAVGCAFAARDLARQLGTETDGWRAYWVVGLASPIAIYALDLWEHSIGAGLMVGAAALLLRTFRGVGGTWVPVLAGALLGLSATMRSESFVVAAAVVGSTCVAVLLRSGLGRAVAIGASTVVGFAAPWIANAVLEDALGGSSRAARAEVLAGQDLWSQAPLRVEEALITWFGTASGTYPGAPLMGLITAATVLLGASFLRREEGRLGSMLLLVAAVCFVLPMLSGLGFVPGALMASPVALLASLGDSWSAERKMLTVAALGGVTLTWAFQFTGGAFPQWGGRYLLAPTVMLTAIGCVVVADRTPLLRRGVTSAAVLVTVFGVAWLQYRTAEIEELFDRLAAVDEDVVISTNGFFVREGGSAYDDRRYLSIGQRGTVAGAVKVVRRAGFESFAVLGETSRQIEGARYEGSRQLEVLGVQLELSSFSVT